jgi:hypothetical protein
MGLGAITDLLPSTAVVEKPSSSPLNRPEMNKNIQIRLAQSTDGKLVLASRTRWTPARECFILRLPEEILYSILELAALGNTATSKYAASQTRSLVFVCRRFNRLANIFLYHTLEFDYHLRAAPVNGRDVLLHRTLRENSSRRSHCRKASITVHDQGEEFGYAVAVSRDLLSWITGAREVVIITTPRGACSPAIWELLRAIRFHLPGAEYIRFKGSPFSQSLEKIVTSFSRPLLKKLSIDFFSSSEVVARPVRHRNSMLAAKTDDQFLLSAEVSMLSSFSGIQRSIRLPTIHTCRN